MPRSLRILAPAVLVALTLTALFVALGIGGGAAERMLLDPGDLVRYGVPISRSLMNVGMAGMIGALVMVVWALAGDAEGVAHRDGRRLGCRRAHHRRRDSRDDLHVRRRLRVAVLG